MSNELHRMDDSTVVECNYSSMVSKYKYEVLVLYFFFYLYITILKTKMLYSTLLHLIYLAAVVPSYLRNEDICI